MKELAAYMMLVLGGKATPSTDDVTSVITAAGGEADAEALSTLMKDLEGKDFATILLASVLFDLSNVLPFVNSL